MRALLLTLVLAGCGTRTAAPPVPTFAERQCAGAGLAAANGYTSKSTATLALAVDTRAGEVADWEERGIHWPSGPRVPRSSWRDLPATEPVALCYYDGPFDNYAPSVPRGSRHPAFERALFIVDARVARLVTIGPAANLPRLK